MNNDKLKNLTFIKDFSKITVVKACKEEKIKTNNLYTLHVSKEKLQRLKDNIDNKIKELYEAYNENSSL